jgi:hypothetical protein
VARARHHAPLHGTKQRAVVPRLDRGELERALLDALADGVQDAGAVLRGQGGPTGECLARGGDRRIDLRAATGDLGDGGLVDGGDVGPMGDLAAGERRGIDVVRYRRI